jgi:hypothetical protein
LILIRTLRRGSRDSRAAIDLAALPAADRDTAEKLKTELDRKVMTPVSN